jgi:hypothetical protein
MENVVKLQVVSAAFGLVLATPCLAEDSALFAAADALCLQTDGNPAKAERLAESHGWSTDPSVGAEIRARQVFPPGASPPWANWSRSDVWRWKVEADGLLGFTTSEYRPKGAAGPIAVTSCRVIQVGAPNSDIVSDLEGYLGEPPPQAKGPLSAWTFVGDGKQTRLVKSAEDERAAWVNSFPSQIVITAGSTGAYVMFEYQTIRKLDD